jgi:hypothetical protein
MSEVINYDSAGFEVIRQYLGICMRELDLLTKVFGRPLNLRVQTRDRERILRVL